MAIFDLPALARPGLDPPVGQDEWGRTVYRTVTGQQYTMPEPPRMAPRAAGPVQGPLAYASPQRMAEMSAYASDLRGMQGSYSTEDIAAAGYSPMEVAAFTTAGRPAVPFSQEADRDRQRAPADVLQEPDYTMRQEATYKLQDELIKRLGMDEYEAGRYARRVMGDPNAAGILESMGLIDIASMLGGSASLAAKGLGLAGRAVAAAPAALSGLFNVEEGTQTVLSGYQEGSALQIGLGALQAVAGMAEMFPASKVIAEGIASTASKMDPNTLYSVFGPPIPPQPVRAPDTGAGSGRPPLTFDEVAMAMQEAPASAPKTAPLDVSRRDASNIFGEGSERVRYTDPQSGGTIEVVVRPDGSASVLELEVPEASRGQGIGQTLQERVMQDFPVMGGQVSSKAAATTAYRLGRRPPGKPDATLEEVFADIDEMSSVNMVSPAMQERLAPAAPSSFRIYQGSPHDFAAERLVRMPDGSTQYIVGSPNVLPDVPAGAEVLRDFPLGRQRMDKIGTGEGAQAYGYGLYGAEAEGVARGYRDALSRPYLATSEGQNIAEKYGDDVANIFEMAGGEPDDMRATVVRLRQIVKENLDDIGVADVSQLKSEFYGDLPSTIIDFSSRADRLESLLNSGDLKLVNTGRMYELEVNANPEDFINYDAPLSAQSLNVQRQFGYVPRPTPQEEIAAYELAKRESPNDIGNHPAVQDIYNRESGANAAERNFQRQVTGGGIDEAARISLSEAGIPGIRYLDAGSRGTSGGEILGVEKTADGWKAKIRVDNRAGVGFSTPTQIITTSKAFPTEADAMSWAKSNVEAGSRNYVIFDENLINIVRKYGIAGAATMLGVSAFDVEQALAENMSPSQWDQLVVGPQ